MGNDNNMTRLLAALLAAGAVGSGADAAVADPRGPEPQASSVRAAGATFSRPSRITNSWLPLSALAVAEFRGTEDGKRVRSLRRVLPRTEPFRIAGQDVAAAVAEDRVYVNGVLREVTLGYHAQADDGTVYYLGKDIDLYAHTGRDVVSHEGSFRYGHDTDVLGVAMPARPRDGMRYAVESIPGRTIERDRIVDTNGRLSVPAGAFHRVLEVHGLLLPEGDREVRWYARGVGVLKEQGPAGTLELGSRA